MTKNNNLKEEKESKEQKNSANQKDAKKPEPEQENRKKVEEKAKEKTPLEKAQEMIKDLQKNLEDQKDKYKYLQAEFENYQKRTQRQQELWKKQEVASIFKKFLPFVDSFDQALEKTSDPNNPPKLESLMGGLQALYKKLEELLKDFKITPMEAHGKPFDYYKHEVLMQTEVDDSIPEDQVMGVVQKGWMIGPDILRHARVVVSKHRPKPPPAESEPKKDEQGPDTQSEAEQKQES